MKITICFLAFIACTTALPAGNATYDDEIDWSNLTPNNIYVKPIKVDTDAIDLPGGRIIGGTEATPNSIPYQAACFIDNRSFCGASLISTTRVLTAAHCTIRASSVQIRFGAHVVQQDESTQLRVTSTNVVNHASYDPDTLANDISIIWLTSAITLNNHIQIVPLSTPTAGSYEGATALLSGWGRPSDASTTISPVLRQVWVTIISNEVCRMSYGRFILDSTLCTSGRTSSGTVGSCNGDSGGPLVVDGVQVGVVSFGAEFCEEGHPSGFARITSFRSWIQQNSGV